jgi:hypothetical protein
MTARLIRIAGWGIRWLGLTGAALVAVIWVSTWFREPWICDHDTIYLSAVAGQFFVSDGRVRFDLASYDRDNDHYRKPRTRRFLAGYTEPYMSLPTREMMHVGRWWPEAINVGPGNFTKYYVFVPIWMPLVAFAVPSALAWWRHARRVRPGQCKTCRYNLAGLATGTLCPECGTSPL